MRINVQISKCANGQMKKQRMGMSRCADIKRMVVKLKDVLMADS